MQASVSEFTEPCMRANFQAIQLESNNFMQRQISGLSNSKSEENGDVYMIIANLVTLI